MTDRIKVTVTEVQPIAVTIRNVVNIPTLPTSHINLTDVQTAATDVAQGHINNNEFDGYKEASHTVTFSGGTESIAHSDMKNIERFTIVAATSATYTLTITGTLVAEKPVTLIFDQTAGPGALDIVYGAKTINVVVNGAAGELQETVEILCDGTDLFVPTDGGVLWTVGV